MVISRRDALLSALFGAGGIGLRALATGLPAAFLLNPRRALAGPACASPAKAQYIVFNTAGGGDPINASSPGTYNTAYSDIIHSPDPLMAPTTITMRGQPFTAAMPWSTLPQAALDRTVFWHLMTNTPVHPKEPQVLELMGAALNNEMFPSLLAKVLAPCLNTIQAQPVALGTEAISFNGQTLPNIPPAALKDTLGSPTGPLTQLQSIRDQTMNQVYAYFRSANGATPAQQAYIDQMVTSQTQVRSLKQNLLATLASITDNSAASQVLAAVTLIQMNVAPVMVVHIPFGGDNHSDPGLKTETSETISGVQAIVSLVAQLQAAGLQDQVTFMSLNVFGRTLATNGSVSAANGRNHNPNHQVSITIGKPFLGGVVGGIAPVKPDYGAIPIQSTTGAGSTGGDISAVDSLGAFAQTVLAGVGADPTVVSAGKVITGALA